MPTFNFDKWSAKDKLDHDKLNQPLDAIQTHLPVAAGPGIVTSFLGSGGTAVSVSPDLRGRYPIITARIVDKGPGGEVDYSDYRYWVQLTKNDLTTSSVPKTEKLDMQVVPKEQGTDSLPVILTVYNLGEYAAGSHGLPLNTDVMISPMAIDRPTQEDAGHVPQTRWFVVGTGASDMGEFQFQGPVMISANQKAWEWDRLHGLTNNA